MLREELRESDIPGRTTIHKRIEETLQEHLDQLSRDMQVSAAATYFLDNLINGGTAFLGENFIHNGHVV
jgi:hypothetical protein